jgi:pimeloyl-ACP methyl ester carboxylesterase
VAAPKRRNSRSRRFRRLGRGLLALLVAVEIGSLIPAVRALAKGLPVLARAAGVGLPRPFAVRVTVEPIHLASGPEGPQVVGDLYLPEVPAPGIVLVPGGAPEGKDDPRLVRLARSIAGANRTVFVPDLLLRNQTFEGSDIERIIRSVGFLRHRVPDGSVGVLGISYGGSFSLIAAEDPRIASSVRYVATFGSYFDLLGVVQGITTGATIDRGRVVRWRTVPEAHRILMDAAVRLSDPAARGPLREALGSGDPSALTPEVRAIYDVLNNRDPRLTPALAERLPPAFRQALAGFSPSTNIGRLQAPLFILQSENDPATPPTEARRLHEAVPRSRLTVLRYFLHVEPGDAGTPLRGQAADVLRAWGFVAELLRAQE